MNYEYLIVIGLLSGLIVWREIAHQAMVQKLINKLMSRNYHEYQSAQTAYSAKESESNGEDIEPDADMGVLGDYTN